MRRKIALGVLVGWLLGIGTGLGVVAITGGWYEYHYFDGPGSLIPRINTECWQPVPGFNEPRFMRRPRIMLGC